MNLGVFDVFCTATWVSANMGMPGRGVQGVYSRVLSRDVVDVSLPSGTLPIPDTRQNNHVPITLKKMRATQNENKI